MKNFKKLLSIAIAAIMSLSAMSTSAFAEKIPGFIYDEETIYLSIGLSPLLRFLSAAPRAKAIIMPSDSLLLF